MVQSASIWLPKGEQGDKGPPGDKGPDGDQGPQGIPGESSEDTSLRATLFGTESPIQNIGSIPYVEGIAYPEGSAGAKIIALEELLASSDTIVNEAGTSLTIPEVFTEIMIKDRVNAAWFGLKATSTLEEQTLALRAAANQALVEGKRLYIPKDNYAFNAGIRIQVPVTMDGGVLDFSQATSVAENSSSALLFEGGGLTALPALSANVTQYDFSITFSSAPAILPGDVLCLYNPTPSSWSTFRANYNAGEFVTVNRVVGNIAYLSSPVYDNYISTAVNIYKVNALKGTFDFGGTELIGPPISITGGCGAMFKNLVRSSILGLTCRSANYAQFSIQQAVDVDIHGCNAFTLENTPTGTQYGVSLANCQSTRIFGGTFDSERHGIAMGGTAGAGAVVTRDCHVTGAKVMSRGTGGGDGAADFHGNVEFSSYQGCTLIGGVTYGGNNNSYRNNKIVSGTVGYAVFAAEPKGNSFDFINNEIQLRGTVPAGRGVFDSVTTTENTTLGGILRISGLKIQGGTLTSAFGVNLRNYGSVAVGRHIVVDNLHMNIPTAAGPIRVGSVSGSNWASVTLGLMTNPGAEVLSIGGVDTGNSRKLTLAAI